MASIECQPRNTLRVLRRGCTDLDVVLACILHDTVEDCVEEILTEFVLRDPATLTPAEQRELALDWLGREFGNGTARLVAAVSNPLPTDVSLSKAEKRERYARHVLEAVTDDTKVFVVKFSDYMDNAAGLYHNDVGGNSGVVAHLAAKYLPVADIFAAEFEANPAIRARVSAAGYEEIGLKLRASKERLTGLVAQYA